MTEEELIEMETFIAEEQEAEKYREIALLERQEGYIVPERTAERRITPEEEKELLGWMVSIYQGKRNSQF